MNEQTRFYAQYMDVLNSIISPALTIFAIMIAVVFAWRFLRNYERNQAFAREEQAMLREEMALARSYQGGKANSQTSITIAGDPTAGGGYDFVQVPDEFKPMFADAMNGFCDYAKLKGYSVELSMETSQPGKVGMKITIADIGVTVSTATVRKDVNEYMQKLKDDDDFSDFPMPENAAEHMIIVSALRARFSYVKTQLEMHKIKADLLEGLLMGVKNSGLGAISYTPPQSQYLQVTVQNDGGKNMGDSYKATNSQNIAQGMGASATTTNSTIQIGNNHNERAERIKALKDFVIDAQASDVPETTKAEVVRYIENAREELEQSSEPDSGFIEKWLDRADKTLSAADAGSNLYVKLLPLLALFGLS
ncbi:DUF2975 domain-containing protein [Agrobacterium vitis]|uniref:DUF2975 domain-containing protein n=1 Tax=Agrobacterium vitis TaxID=373 RepID=A0A368NY18_AGRVI|nr:DUF2975 domain-containing protein [Agrobacterium vitis]KAA3519858.1 DUF2975 domain-containing protein [Agrobacterium vitis]KAA3531929.1 DUF2975 domain-containing protein [Agrobacterium vitis]MCF1476041.1 DUF2975 domain-containing protein [Agrobacterium vitis]MUZ96900.1 hypothetical protein [Agrobacterium vitis]MVA29073.1 hypothetical protein [Agrobacterium vitis]